MWVKRDIDPFETERLKSMHLDWVTFHTESQRHYPKRRNRRRMFWAAGRIPRMRNGAAGRGARPRHRAARPRRFRAPGRWTCGIADSIRTWIRRRRPGIALTLSIDERMQYVAERELKAGVRWPSTRAAARAIVMNPYTGEILALANYPDLRSQQAAEARATIRLRASIWARRCPSSQAPCSRSSRSQRRARNHQSDARIR